MVSSGPHAAPPADARDCALRRLAEQAARFPTLDLAPLDASGLAPRDQALAHAIYDAVLRHWLAIEVVLSAFLKRPLRAAEPAVQAALLGGAAQTLLLDRIPEHAAIDESVRWVKRIRPTAGGLVNGVLRNVLRAVERDAEGAIVRRESFTGRADELPLPDGRAIGFGRPMFPEDAAARLNAQASLSPWLVRRWLAREASAATRRALHTLVRPPIVLNVAHAAGPVPADGASPHDRSGSLVFDGPRADLLRLLTTRSDLWVQDSASAALLPALAPRLAAPPRLIVDACAGSGTKTRQLRALFPQTEIIASDPDNTRSATLAETFAGDPAVRIATPEEARSAALGSADLVLLDVPCTNSGVLARRPEARYRATQKQLDRLCATQRQIIADAIPLLAPRGAIMYTTCSLEPEENTGQRAWVQRWHHADAVAVVEFEPCGSPGDPPSGYADGAFGVLLTGFGR